MQKHLDIWFAQGTLIHAPDHGGTDVGALIGEAKTDASARSLVERHNALVRRESEAQRLTVERLHQYLHDEGVWPDDDEAWHLRVCEGALASPSPDSATEPSTEQFRAWLINAMLDAGFSVPFREDERFERLAATLRTAVAHEREARAASVPPALDDATRLRDWIAKHRTVCPIMRESANKLHALLAAEAPEPEASEG